MMLRTTLLSLAAATTLVVVAAGNSYPEVRHRAVLQRIPRIPMTAWRRLSRHLDDLEDWDNDEWGNDEMNMNCEYDNDNGMDCILLTDDGQYQVDENCTGDEDVFVMSCNVCAHPMDKEGDPFEFCYQVDCDFSALLTDPLGIDRATNVSSFSNMEQELCTCKYARINDELCDYCGICPSDVPQDMELIGMQMFANMALQCPDNSFVTSSCDASTANNPATTTTNNKPDTTTNNKPDTTTNNKPDTTMDKKPVTTDTPTSRGEEVGSSVKSESKSSASDSGNDGMSGGAKAGLVLLLSGVVLGVFYVSVRRSSSRNVESSVPQNAEDQEATEMI